MTARIGLVSGGRDWAAKLICRTTRSPYHHVMLARDDEWCLSAEPSGVKPMRIDHFHDPDGIGTTVTWLPVIGTPEQRALALAFAEAAVGTRYNKVAFVFAGLHSLGAVPLRAEEPLDRVFSRFGYTCSALVDSAYFAGGIDLLPCRSLFVYPSELSRARIPV